MPRRSAIAPVMSRNSAVADRPGAPQDSPFRSSLKAKRVVAARSMIEKRQAEISALEKALESADNVKVQRILTTRLLASRNNLRSWEAYIASPEQEPRAVINPPTRSR